MGSLFASVVLLLTVVLSLFIRKTVIKPVKIIAAVCAEVTEGKFDRRVTIRSRDEIGSLGATVNTVVEGLHERFELQKYVSSNTLESLLGDKTGKKRTVTLLFTDIRGFTDYTDRKEAEAVVTNLNAVLNTQSEIIQKHGGDIDKYVGDEIVAMFVGEAIHAIRAAVEIQSRLSSSSPDYDGLCVGIGIKTGTVILGMIGSERRADYTFIGENVNASAWLCEAAEPGQILIADSTYESIQNEVVVEGPFRLRAKGKNTFTKVYKVLSLQDPTNGDA